MKIINKQILFLERLFHNLSVCDEIIDFNQTDYKHPIYCGSVYYIRPI